MMAEHLAALQERRRVLRSLAEEERDALATVLGRADTAGAWLNAGLSMLSRIRRHPVLLAGAVAALVALRPRLSLKWLLRAWSAWRVVRAMRAGL
jgi:hypothetical protein